VTNDITRIIVEAVCSVAVILITTYVIPWLKEKVGAEKYNQLQKYCELAVRSAEQMYTAEEWKSKKAYVVSCISAKLSEIGLELNDVEVNAIIEGCVNLVKKGQ